MKIVNGVRVITEVDDTEIVSDVISGSGVCIVYGHEHWLAGEYLAEECFATIDKLNVEGEKYITCTDIAPKLCEAMDLKAIPAILIIKDGVVKASAVGIATTEQYQAFINTGGVMP